MSISITATPNSSNASFSLTVSGLTGVNTITVSRNNPDGSVATVRSAGSQPTGGATTMAFFDFEAPLDQLVTYTVTPDVGSPVTGSAVKITTDGQTFWLKNVSQETLSTKVTMASMSPLTRRARILATYPVLGRANPIVVSDVRAGREGTMVLTTADATAAKAVRSIFTAGNALFLQCPASTNFPDMYFSAGDIAEAWVPDWAATALRTFSVPFIEVDSPTDGLVSTGANSWSQVAQFGSWNNLKNKRVTWLDVLNRPYTSADAG